MFDELDVKIFRALISESAIAPSGVQVKLSLREIARQLGADDMTVRNRFRKLKDSGCMSVWQLVVNPTFFGYKMLDVTVDVQPESAKADMIRKLKLIHGLMVIVNFYGKALKIILLYDTKESRSRTVQLISRITNAEKVTILQLPLPKSETKQLSETDIAIIRSLSVDARKSSVVVGKELGISNRTVGNRIDKLRKEKTLFIHPNLNLDGVPGLIPACLSFSYANDSVKDAVDKTMREHFDANYLWGAFGDRSHAYLVLSAPSLSHVQRFLDWANQHQGIASARIDIPVGMVSFPERFAEFLRAEDPRVV